MVSMTFDARRGMVSVVKLNRTKVYQKQGEMYDYQSRY